MKMNFNWVTVVIKMTLNLSNFQNFVFLLTIDVSVFYISYPFCVDIIQWQTDIIPTEYWESNIWKKFCHFPIKQYFWLRCSAKTETVNFSPKQSKLVMWLHWWGSNDINIIFPATLTIFGLPGKLASFQWFWNFLKIFSKMSMFYFQDFHSLLVSEILQLNSCI